MANHWDESALDWFERARRGPYKFLQDLDKEHFVERSPIICVSCADLYRNYDMVKHTARLRGFAPGEDHKTHRLSWHGGIMRIVSGSPTNIIPESDEIFLAELLEAHEITQLGDFVIYAHWPCSKGLKHGLTIENAANHLIIARTRLKTINPELKIKALFHVDLPEGVSSTPGMKSYFVDPKGYALFTALQ